MINSPFSCMFFTYPWVAECQLSLTHTLTCLNSSGLLFTLVFSSCSFKYTRYTYSWRSKVCVIRKCTHSFIWSTGLQKYQLPLPSIAFAIVNLLLSINNAGIRLPQPLLTPVVRCNILVHPITNLVGLKSKENSYCIGSEGKVVTNVFFVMSISLSVNIVNGILSTGRSENREEIMSYSAGQPLFVTMSLSAPQRMGAYGHFEEDMIQMVQSVWKLQVGWMRFTQFIKEPVTFIWTWLVHNYFGGA